MKKFRKLVAMLAMVVMISSLQPAAYGATMSEYKNGTYDIGATLSCYVNAMGGVEFGGPLLDGAKVTIKDNSATMTLYFKKSTVTIYGVTCDTFFDPTGTTGYYKNGSLTTAGMTTIISNDTALNPSNEAVKYLASMTFPLSEISEKYELALFVNSNVMGSQFGTGNNPATLTVDWSDIPLKSGAATDKDDTSSETTGNKQETNSNSNKNNSNNANNSSDKNTVDMEQSNDTKVDSKDTTSDEATTTDNEEKDTSVKVEEDGLNIYYADGSDIKKDNEVSPALVVGILAAIATVAAGGIYLYKKKFKKDR